VARDDQRDRPDLTPVGVECTVRGAAPRRPLTVRDMPPSVPGAIQAGAASQMGSGVLRAATVRLPINTTGCRRVGAHQPET